jgi:hypothetical protein
MLRTFQILSFTLVFISCNKKQNQTEVVNSSRVPANKVADVLAPVPVDRKVDVPAQAETWDAEPYMVNFSPAQEEKVRKAVLIIKKVIQSNEFKDRVLNYSYKGGKTFFESQGLSNKEVYQKILEGSEKMGNTARNNTMDVELELYHQKTTTIGYTYPNTVRIWMNTKYFNKYTPIKVADNLMHEWMHKLGFTHATTWSKDRDHSVPYAIGYLIEELANKQPN